MRYCRSPIADYRLSRWPWAPSGVAGLARVQVGPGFARIEINGEPPRRSPEVLATSAKAGWPWALIGVLLLAAVLRCVDLEGRTLWCDELLSVRRASGTIGQLIDALLKVEHVPLYELSLSFWMQLGQGDAWIRLLSSVYGIATIVVVYLAFARMTSHNLALGVALLTALSPLHVYWSRIARPYSLLPLVSWLATYLLLRLLTERQWWIWVAYTAAAALCLYTHYFGVLLLAAHNLIFFAHHLRSAPRRLWAWLAGQVVVGLLFLPWLLANLATTVEASSGQLYYASQGGLLVKLPYFFFVFSLGWTVNPLCWPIVAPAVFVFGWTFLRGTVAVRRGSQVRAARTALAIFGLPLLVGWFVPACSPKHQLPGLPAYAFVVLCGISAVRQRWLRSALLAAIIMLDAAALMNYFRNQQYTDIDVVVPWRDLVAVVEEYSAEGDAIVLGYNPAPFLWYYEGDLPVYRFVNNDLADRTRYHRFQRHHGQSWLTFGDRDNVDPAACDRLLREHGRLWLMLFKDDPRDEMEAWMKRAGRVVIERAYQFEEETLRGLREGLQHIHKYRTHYYKLYLVEGADAAR